MSGGAAPAERRYATGYVRWAIVIAIVSVIIVSALGPQGAAQVGRAFAAGHLHAPRFELIAQAPLVIQLHLATVLGALVLGTVLMLGVKGTRIHRVLGWTVAIFLMATAIDALFIGGFNGGFTPLHLFSLFTILAVPSGIYFARNHMVARHGRTMSGLYFGGLLLAGVIAFMPGRLMWRVFFG